MEQTPNATGPIDAYTLVYAALDRVWTGRKLPCDSIGMMHKSVEKLRAAAAPREDIDLAERISVIFHRIEWTRRAGEELEEDLARAELDMLGRAWMLRHIGPPQQAAHARS